MFDRYVTFVGSVAYFHPLLVICLCLISTWLPSLMRGLLQLLRPICSALAALIRKFIIFR